MENERYKCDYCSVDLSDFRVKCAHCVPEFNLCFQCFTSGPEIGNHVSTHSYIICSMPLYPVRKNWTINDEFSLLHKTYRYGYGNWATVADYMRNKTPEEVESHFLDVYVNGSIGQANMPLFQAAELLDKSEKISGEIPYTETNCSPGLEELYRELTYSPERNWFYTTGYDVDAESIFNNLEGCFLTKKSDTVTALAVACVNMYRNRLKERYRVEKLIKDYDLIKLYYESEQAKSSQTNRKKSHSDEKKQMKPFCRLLARSEYDAIIEGEIKERNLRMQVRKLKETLMKRSSTSKSSINKGDGVDEKQSTYKENDQRKMNTSARGSPMLSSRAARKEEKSSSCIGKSRKRRFQEEENLESKYAENCRDLLSRAEKKLCSSLDLEPSSYMALKIVLLRERNIMKEDTSNPICSHSPSNINVVQKVSKFMSNNGWIKSG